MNESQQPNGQSNRSWFERLSQILLGEPKDREHLVEFLRDAEERNLLDADALVMIEGVLSVSEMRVRDIMVPRYQMVVVERDAPLEALLPVIVESGHSRFPVVGESRDDVVGILLAKDLLAYFMEGRQGTFNMREILRPAAMIPESKRLNVLLREFRASRNHMALVVDEYGGIAGLVTIEDVLEQIVGEIADEHDTDEGSYIMKYSDGKCTVKGLTPIEDFNAYFSGDFSDEEFDTIGGLVMQGLGHMPKRGESLTIGEFTFKVLHADSRRIHLLEVIEHADKEGSPRSAHAP